MLYMGKSIECFARAIEHNQTISAPRLAEYVRHFHASSIGIKADTTEEIANELMMKAAKTYPTVAIRPRSSIDSARKSLWPLNEFKTDSRM